MPKPCVLAVMAMFLGGCQDQIALGVEQMTGTIPLILEDNMIGNLVRLHDDPDSIVAQVALKESVSTAANGLSYGASPSIALRAIAITGISAGVTNSLSYNWSVDPVNGSADQLRLQILFRYALGRSPSGFQGMESLMSRLASAGYMGADWKEADRKRAAIREAMTSYPELPHGDFVKVGRADCTGDDYLTNDGLPRLRPVCFVAQRSEMDGQVVTGRALASRLVLWSILLPELSKYAQQLGASNGGDSKLSIPANGSVSGNR